MCNSVDYLHVDSRFGGTPAETASSSSGSGDLETLKQELLTEMRKELQKIKDEIVQGFM